MKLAKPSPYRGRARGGISWGHNHKTGNVKSYEVQPLVTEDEELFLDGDLDAAEYLSRATSEGVDENVRSRGYQRTEFALGVSLAVAGIAFFAAATKLFSGGSDLALLGLLISGGLMLAVQLTVELRRRNRHKGSLYRQEV